MALKFCPKCGNELEPDASFCDACGAKLTERKETTSASTTSAPTLKSESVIYAPFLKRLIAIILDGIIIGLIGSSFTFLLINPWYRINFFDPIGAWWFTMPFDWFIGFLYFWGLETYNNGQTLGKMLFNIRTVDENTLDQATSSNYAVNNLLKPSGLLIIDFLIGLFKNSGDPKNRIRIMQNISETVVIMTK